MSKALERFEPMLQQIEAQEQAEAEQATQPVKPVDASEYFGEFLRERGVEETPELMEILNDELNRVFTKHRDRIQQQRIQLRDNQLRGERDQFIATAGQSNSLDRAALAVEMRKKGLGQPIQLSPRDEAVWDAVMSESPQILQRAAERLKGLTDQTRQADLMEQYKADLAKLPRGFSLMARTELQNRYRRMGLIFPGDEQPTAPKPQTKPPKLNQDDQARLMEEYHREVMPYRRTNIRMVVEIQKKYRRLGLNV